MGNCGKSCNKAMDESVTQKTIKRKKSTLLKQSEPTQAPLSIDQVDQEPQQQIDKEEILQNVKEKIQQIKEEIKNDKKEIIKEEIIKEEIKQMDLQAFQLLNRWEKFEKKFPFYRINITNFIKLMNNAQRLSVPLKEYEPQPPLCHVDYVTLDSLQKAFADNELWSDELRHDEAGEDSILIQFLNATCKYEEEGLATISYDVTKLSCLAMLWCDGTDQEKAVELYELFQDKNEPVIIAQDKDIPISLKMIFDFAGYHLLQNESIVFDKKQFQLDMTEEEIKVMREERYDEVCEEFIDQVFGYDSKFTRDQFLKLFLNKTFWIFNTNDIRNKIGWQT